MVAAGMVLLLKPCTVEYGNSHQTYAIDTYAAPYFYKLVQLLSEFANPDCFTDSAMKVALSDLHSSSYMLLQ